MNPTPQEIENRLDGIDRQIEFLALESAGGDGLRLFIDHPDGVTLELCQKVTSGLQDVLVDHSLEVSSPGPERPLTKPGHFERFSGRRAKVTTTEPFEGRRNFTGTIVEAREGEVVLESDGQNFEIPFASIERSHLVPEIPQGAAK
ncbi:MAG: ribosome maturation factor RimP [Solirubrobacterales bacterium]|nr:ribosome maturation factor RimP [Solirubrobacterales bacterium]